MLVSWTSFKDVLQVQYIRVLMKVRWIKFDEYPTWNKLSFKQLSFTDFLLDYI
jgi:hypothetical protein